VTSSETQEGAPPTQAASAAAAAVPTARAAAMLVSLDEAQRAAAQMLGPALVIGPAGSGKTRVLAHRVAMLVARGDVPPRRILGFARSDREAGLLRARAERLLGQPLHGAWIDTPREICLRILRAHAAALGRKPSFVVLGESEARVLVRGAARDAGVTEYSPGRLQELISLSKIARVAPDGPVGEVYALYERALAEANAFDADDLVRHVVELLGSDPALAAKYHRRFSHTVIDDFEDTSAPQRELFARLVGGDGDVLAAADEQQAIASAAAGDDDPRSGFLAAFPGAQVVTLDRSYRGSGRITLLAARVAARNLPPATSSPPRPAPEAMRKRGRRVVSAVMGNEADEATHVVRWLARIARRLKAPLSRCAILYRHPVQARPFEEALARAGVAYRVVGAPRFYERREIKDVIAYLKLTIGGGDPAALARIANVPRRGIGPASVATIARLARQSAAGGGARLSMAEAALRAASLPRVTAQRAGALADLGRLLTDLTDAARRLSAAELIDYAIERSGYGRLLGELSRAEEETRREGIDELRGMARALDGPAALTLPALFARAGQAAEDADDADLEPASASRPEDVVALLTFAESKGRDFDVVFMTGLEEGILPGARAARLGDAAIRAERRLFYVGITRARSRLVFTHALSRTLFGKTQAAAPSRFLGEVGKRVRSFRLGEARARAVGVPLEIRPGVDGEGDTGPLQVAAPLAPTLTVVREGQRVVHPRYGHGLVTRFEPAAGGGGQPMVSVLFESAGEKRLALAFAKLQPA
jgi:DNA helicase-2/ATP-dependent DNA helicase PcrA